MFQKQQSLGFKELTLGFVPSEKPPSNLFFSQKPLQHDNKPFFSYSQPFGYKNWLFLASIEANVIDLRVHALCQGPLNILRRFEFDENISGTLSMGSLWHQPYLLVPLINGVSFLIDLQEVLQMSHSQPKFSTFEVDLGGNCLLFMENLSDLMKDQQKAWNLVLVASVSNGTLRLFEGSISSDNMFLASHNENSINYLPDPQQQLACSHEISLFSSGLLSKLKTFLVTPTDAIVASLYFSCYLMFAVTRQGLLKVVNLSTRTVLFGTQLDLDLDNSGEGGYQQVKILSLARHPTLRNNEKTAYFMIAVGVLEAPESSRIQLLSLGISFKRVPENYSQEFLFLRALNHEITGSIDIYGSQLVTLPVANSTIRDFLLIEDRLVVASSELDSEKTEIFISGINSDGIRLEPVVSRELRSRIMLLEEEELRCYADNKTLIDRILQDQRFSEESLCKCFNLAEKPKEMAFLLQKFNNEELMGLVKQLDSFETNGNRIKAMLWVSEKQGFPLIFRDCRVSALKPLELLESAAERLELARGSKQKPQNSSHLTRLAFSFEKDSKTSQKGLFAGVFMAKLALRFCPVLLGKAFKSEHRSFGVFMREKVRETLSQLEENCLRSLVGVVREVNVKGSCLDDFLEDLQRVFYVPGLKDTILPQLYQADYNTTPSKYGSLINSYFAAGLKAGINSYAGICLDVLVFFSVYQELNGGDIPAEMQVGYEALAKLSAVMMALGRIEEETFNRYIKENTFCVDLISEAMRNSNFDALSIKIQEITAKILAWTVNLESFDRFDVDYVPNIARFLVETQNFSSFERFYEDSGLRNPSLEFLKTLGLARVTDGKEKATESLEKALGFVDSFVNFDKLPGFEGRDLFCLGPWFVYQHMEAISLLEGLRGSKLVLLQNCILVSFFNSLKRVRGTIAGTALGFEITSKELKSRFLRELLKGEMNQDNFLAAANVFLSVIETEQTPQFLMEFISELQKKRLSERFFAVLPLDHDIFSRIRSMMLTHYDLQIEVLGSDLLNLDEGLHASLIAKHRESTQVLTLLVSALMGKNSFDEVIEILLHILQKLLSLAQIKVLINKEAYAQILSLAINWLDWLISSFELQNSTSPMVPNMTLVAKQDEQVLDPRDDISSLLRLGNKAEKTLFKADFRKLRLKIEMLASLVVRSEASLSNVQLPVSIPAEEMIRQMVKARMLEEAATFACFYGANAQNLLVYLTERMDSANENQDSELSADWFLELIEMITEKADESVKRDYLRAVCETILQNYEIQKNKEDDLPSRLADKYRKIEPTGLINLYLKYNRNEKAGFEVLTYVRSRLVEGNRRLTLQRGTEAQERRYQGFVAPSVILAVMELNENVAVKEEVVKMLETLTL